MVNLERIKSHGVMSSGRTADNDVMLPAVRYAEIREKEHAQGK